MAFSDTDKLSPANTTEGSLESHAESHAFYSSLVFEHIVAKTQQRAFETWHQSLEQVARQHPGFVRLDLNSPLYCENDVIKWYSIIHFDSPENLNHWMNSQERKAVIERGQSVFRAYRFKSFTTGLEGWFSRRASDDENSGLGPPAWKQILSVVFGLYPIVMIRLKLFPGTGLVGEWSPSGAMLLATLVTSSILAVVVMPVVTKMMKFWLYPAYRKASWKHDVLGAMVMGLGFIFMAALFDRI